MTRTVVALALALCLIDLGVQGRIRTGDEGLRKLATSAPAPTYPSVSLAKKTTGVVVAAIQIDAKGTAESVAILQSPDTETGRAVHDALAKWTFRPLGSPAEGILVFYFHMKGREAVVLSPAEMRAVINPAAKNLSRDEEPPAKHLREAEFRAISTRPGPLLLDIRDRETFSEGHEKGAVNIPLTELLPRGPAELPASRHVVIDCRDPLDYCTVAAHFLTSSGFKNVSILRR